MQSLSFEEIITIESWLNKLNISSNRLAYYRSNKDHTCYDIKDLISSFVERTNMKLEKKYVSHDDIDKKLELVD